MANALKSDLQTLLETWRAQVDRDLKGAPFEKRLQKTRHGGIPVGPLYTRLDAPAQEPPAATRPLGTQTLNLTVHTDPDADTLGAALDDDAQGGAGGVWLKLGGSLPLWRGGGEGDDALTAGVLLPTADALAGALPAKPTYVALDGGAAFLPTSALLIAAWEQRGIGPADMRGWLRADPLGALATTGQALPSVETSLADMAALAHHLAEASPGLRAVGVDVSPYYNGGADIASCLGIALATGVTYLRAMTDAGMGIDAALAQVGITLPMEADLFMAIASLRAARRLWARVTSVVGGAGPVWLHAVTADLHLTARDPWVNMLRGSTAAFAGMVGGADAVTVTPYDANLGETSDRARRVARNTALILGEESGLDRVADAAGGSYYVESLTHALCEAAWARFQAIEAAGGMATWLVSGAAAQWIAPLRQERERATDHIKAPITGVSAFANVEEVLPEAPRRDIAALRAAYAKGGQRPEGVCPNSAVGRVRYTLNAARAGAGLAGLVDALGSERALFSPWEQRPLAAAFEALRSRASAHAAKTGHLPTLAVLHLTDPAGHRPRTAFVADLVASAGMVLREITLTSESSLDEALGGPARGAAVVCARDEGYAAAQTACEALRGAGARWVGAVGHPRKLGLETSPPPDGYLFLGCDALTLLSAMLTAEGA